MLSLVVASCFGIADGEVHLCEQGWQQRLWQTMLCKNRLPDTPNRGENMIQSVCMC